MNPRILKYTYIFLHLHVMLPVGLSSHLCLNGIVVLYIFYILLIDHTVVLVVIAQNKPCHAPFLYNIVEMYRAVALRYATISLSHIQVMQITILHVNPTCQYLVVDILYQPLAWDMRKLGVSIMQVCRNTHPPQRHLAVEYTMPSIYIYVYMYTNIHP